MSVSLTSKYNEKCYDIFNCDFVPHRAYLADVVEVCHIFCKIMEHFCKGGVLVQRKQTKRRTGKKHKPSTKKPPTTTTQQPLTEVRISHMCFGFSTACLCAIILTAHPHTGQEELHNRWASSAGQISAILADGNASGDANDAPHSSPRLPDHERPVPYDAVAEQPIDDQK